MGTYKKYSLILDLEDEEDKVLIDYIERKHGKKRKNSFSTILRTALKELMLKEKDVNTEA